VLKKLVLLVATACLAVSLLTTSAYASSTGPYRRVNSKIGTSIEPYTYEEIKVTLPSSSNIKEQTGTNDCGYIYLGGTGPTGVEIDAGLQHSPTYNNWAPIIRCNGSVFYTPSLERFKASQTVTMVFYVADYNKVVLKVTGTVDSGAIKTLVVTCTNATGWSKTGIGNRFKRVTSIGQQPQNLYNSSYIKGIHWYDAYIGTVSSHHAWLAADTSGYISYPANSPKVSVFYKNAGEETDTIDLTK